MTSQQQRQVDVLSQHGWEMAQEKEDHLELIHITLPSGAFSVAKVYPHGGYMWEGNYPLAKLGTMYPTYDYVAGE